LLPVSTVHRRVAGSSVDDISIQIGHVKGKINPTLRNILCWSGIIHVVDTVLAIPTLSAYQQISSMTGLTSFKSLIDNSQKYSQLLQQLPMNVVYPTQPPQRSLRARNKRQQNLNSRQDPSSPIGVVNSNQQLWNQAPMNSIEQQSTQIPQIQQQQQQMNFNQQQQQQQMNFNQQQQQYLYQNDRVGSTSNTQYMTILAANDAALFNLYPILIANSTALDQFLSTHIIIDSDMTQNRIFYTDHDQNVFLNGQVYTTFNPTASLVATVTQMPNEVSSSKSRLLNCFILS
jgi:hypothetical protein